MSRNQRGKRPDKVPARVRSRETQGHCDPCGKWFYADRKTAKEAARKNHPGEHLHPYRCEHRDDLWHYGNPQEWGVRGHERGIYDPDAQLRRDIAAHQHDVAADAVRRILAATGPPDPGNGELARPA